MTVFDHHVSRFAHQHLLHGRYAFKGGAGRERCHRGADVHNGNRPVVIEELGPVDGDRQREVALLSSLSHPNLLPVYEVFSEQGSVYLVTEAIGGKTLLQLLREQKGLPLPLPLVLACARQLCDVLIYLARCEPPIIVRDLHLSSVLVSEKGQVYLVGPGLTTGIQQGIQQEDRNLPSPASPSPEHPAVFPSYSGHLIVRLGQLLRACLTGKEHSHMGGRDGRESLRHYNYQVPVELDRLIQRLVTYDERHAPISLDEVQQSLMHLDLQAEEHTIEVTVRRFGQNVLSPPESPDCDTLPVRNRLPMHASGRVVSPALERQVSNSYTRGRVWRTRFVALSTLALVLLLGGSLCALIPIRGSAHYIEFGWSIVLLIAAITSASSRLPRRVLLPWALLLPVALLSLLTGLAFLVLASPAAQRVLGGVLQATSLEQVITWGLAGAALISLLWLTRPFALRNRLSLLCVFAAAGACVLSQQALRDETTLRQALGSEALHKHVLLVVALALLVWGILVAVHMERAREQEDSVNGNQYLTL